MEVKLGQINNLIRPWLASFPRLAFRKFLYHDRVADKITEWLTEEIEILKDALV